MFLQVCVILFTVGHAWLLRGACMVATGGVRGCPWDMHGCSRGAGVVAPEGGVHGCSQGACVVALGGCLVAARGAWLLSRGVHGCS